MTFVEKTEKESIDWDKVNSELGELTKMKINLRLKELREDLRNASLEYSDKKQELQMLEQTISDIMGDIQILKQKLEQ